jgi:hypothetical protein
MTDDIKSLQALLAQALPEISIDRRLALHVAINDLYASLHPGRHRSTTIEGDVVRLLERADREGVIVTLREISIPPFAMGRRETVARIEDASDRLKLYRATRDGPAA